MFKTLLALGALCAAGQMAVAEGSMPAPDLGLGDMASDPPRATAPLDMPAGSFVLGGNGRFGLIHEDGETSVSSRLRLNLDANRVTDGGLTFGGKFRMQSQSGDSGAGVNAGKLYLQIPGP